MFYDDLRTWKASKVPKTHATYDGWKWHPVFSDYVDAEVRSWAGDFIDLQPPTIFQYMRRF